MALEEVSRWRYGGVEGGVQSAHECSFKALSMPTGVAREYICKYRDDGGDWVSGLGLWLWGCWEWTEQM